MFIQSPQVYLTGSSGGGGGGVMRCHACVMCRVW